MRDLTGKTAFVTGGASGVGFAPGHAFAKAGMKVMLADIEAGALSTAVSNLGSLGLDARGVDCVWRVNQDESAHLDCRRPGLRRCRCSERRACSPIVI